MPAEITIDLLMQKIRTFDTRKVVLIDGFPRNQDNKNQWFSMTSASLEAARRALNSEAQEADHSRGDFIQVDKVILVNQEADVLKERLIRR